MFVNHSLSLEDEMDTMVPPKRRGSPERSVQISLKRYLEAVLPGVIVAAVKNEIAAKGATKLQRARFYQKRAVEGTLAGFPDLVIDTLDQGVFYVETKAPGGVISAAQLKVHHDLRAHGRAVIVADSVESLRLGLQRAGISVREAAGAPVREAKVRVAKAKRLPADKVPF